MSLPIDAALRKRLQLYTFMFEYFPEAWLAIVDVARAGNDQHNPGEPMHWAREKSKDQMNALFNHLVDYGLGEKKDTDGCYHLAKMLWRGMAQLQLDIEAERSSKDVRLKHDGRNSVALCGAVATDGPPCACERVAGHDGPHTCMHGSFQCAN